MKLYNSTLGTAGDITVGKIYYKDTTLCSPLYARLPEIKIISHSGGNCVVTIGEDTLEQTITEAQTLAYINSQGGYSDTIWNH